MAMKKKAPEKKAAPKATGSDSASKTSKKTVLSKKESVVYAKAKSEPGYRVPARSTMRVENGDMSTGVEFKYGTYGFGKNEKGSKNRARKAKQKER
jgi:hypothetical protein